MKKVFFTALALVAFNFSNAQDISFGAKAGLNLSNVTGDVEGTSMKTGFQIGGFAEIAISDEFSIQPELVYSTQGAKEEEEFFGVTYEGSLNLSYINVPVMAKYYITEGLSLEAGPQIGFLVSAEYEAEGETSDVKEFYNSTDFGFNIGAGYNVTENINASLRYTAGMSNILKDSDDYKAANSNIAIALAYKF